MTKTKVNLRITIAFWVVNFVIVFYATAMAWIIAKTTTMYIEHWHWFGSSLRLAMFLIANVSAIMFFLLLVFIRNFLNYFRKFEFFNTNSIKSLKRISFTLMLFILLCAANHALGSYDDMTHFKGAEIPIPISFYVSLSCIAIFIWLLLPAFLEGRQLKNESDLTV